MTQYFDQGEAGAAEQALQDYLDALLQPAAAPPRAAPRPFAEPVKPLPLRLLLPPVAPEREAPVAVERRAVPVAGPAVQAPPVAELRAEASGAAASGAAASGVATSGVATPAIVQPAIETAPPRVIVDAVAPADALRPADWLANGRPHWAQQAFECLLFNVGGLRLAVPLVELGSIYPLATDRLTPLFGQAEWFMGLLPTKQGSIRVIDAAQVVMPERYRPELRDGYRYVITLDGSDWGLAADSVADALTLEPAAVRWRGERSKRPWLAGTVVEQMCALIDAAQLNWLFHRQDRRRHDGRGPT